MDNSKNFYNKNLSNECFWKEARIIFMAQREAPTPPSPPEGIEKLKAKKYDIKKYNEKFEKEFFENAKTKIKLALESLVRAAPEGFKKLAKKFQTELANKAAAKLEHLFEKYKEEALRIGLDNDYEDIREQFNEKVDKYVKKITDRFGERTKAVRELRYFAYKEKMSEVQSSPRKMHKLRTEIVKYMLKGRGCNEQLVDGMAPYIARRIGRLKFTTVAQLQKHIENQLDSDTNIMSQALQDLINESPLVKTTSQERSFVRDVLVKNELYAAFGKENLAEAATQISKQLHIVFDNSGKPIAYVDMASGDMRPKQTDEKGLAKKIEEIVDHISSLKPTTLGSKLDRYKDNMDDLSDAQATKLNFLREGAVFNRRIGEAIDELSDLKKHPELEALITETAPFRRYMDVVKPFQGNKEARDVLTQAFAKGNEQAIKMAESARDNDIKGNALVELFKLIQQILTGKAPDYARDKVQAKLDKGSGNPAEELKIDARKNYERTLKKANPPVDKLLAFYLNPESKEATKFFQKNALSKTEKDKLDAMQLAATYPGERSGVIKNYMEKQLGVTGLNVKIEGADEFKFTFVLGTQPKIFTVKRIRGDKFEITDKLENKTTKINRTFAALTNEFKPKKVPAKLVAKKEATAEKIPTNTRYIDKSGVLKNITDKVKIHDVSDPKEISETIIKTGHARKERQGFKPEAEVRVEQKGNTFVIAKGQKNEGRQLYVFNGDTIISVKRKSKSVASAKKERKAA